MKAEEILDLSTFTEEEVEKLKEVIRRDKVLQRREEHRLEKLEKQLQFAWRPVSLTTEEQCCCCGESFNFLFNPKVICQNCSLSVCKECSLEYKKKEYLLCKICDAKNGFMAKSGQWKMHFVVKQPEEGVSSAASVIPGLRRSASDILTASIRRQKRPPPADSAPPSTTLPQTARVTEDLTSKVQPSSSKVLPPTEATTPVSPAVTDKVPPPATNKAPPPATDIAPPPVTEQARLPAKEATHDEVTTLQFDETPQTKPRNPILIKRPSETPSADGLLSPATEAGNKKRRNSEKLGPRVKIAETEAIVIPESAVFVPPPSDDDDKEATASDHELEEAARMLQSTDEENEEEEKPNAVVPRPLVITDSNPIQKPVIALNDVTLDEQDTSNQLAAQRDKMRMAGSMLSVYSETEESFKHNLPATGEIIFELVYVADIHTLVVDVICAKNLPPVDAKKGTSDTYVKTYLLPDKTQPSKRKTAIKRGTVNPDFHERLEYFMPQAELRTRTLSVAVWHRQKFIGHNLCLGEVLLPLKDWDFTKKPQQSYQLQKKSLPNTPPSHNVIGSLSTALTISHSTAAVATGSIIYKGDLVFALKYTTPNATQTSKGAAVPSPGALQIWIKEARNVMPDQASLKPDAFAKLYLLPDRSSKGKRKTQVIRKSKNPQWNFMVQFAPVSVVDLRYRSLEITIWNYGRLKSNEFLGGLRLNLGTGMLADGELVPWMQARGPAALMWEAMLMQPDTWIEGGLLLQPNMD